MRLKHVQLTTAFVFVCHAEERSILFAFEIPRSLGMTKFQTIRKTQFKSPQLLQAVAIQLNEDEKQDGKSK